MLLTQESFELKVRWIDLQVTDPAGSDGAL